MEGQWQGSGGQHTAPTQGPLLLYGGSHEVTVEEVVAPQSLWAGGEAAVGGWMSGWQVVGDRGAQWREVRCRVKFRG